MVEVEGKLITTTVSILIYQGATLSYNSPNLVETYKLGKTKHTIS